MYICLMHSENDEYESWSTFTDKSEAEKWVEETWSEYPEAAFTIYWGERKALSIDAKVTCKIS